MTATNTIFTGAGVTIGVGLAVLSVALGQFPLGPSVLVALVVLGHLARARSKRVE